MGVCLEESPLAVLLAHSLLRSYSAVSQGTRCPPHLAGNGFEAEAIDLMVSFIPLFVHPTQNQLQNLWGPMHGRNVRPFSKNY